MCEKNEWQVGWWPLVFSEISSKLIMLLLLEERNLIEGDEQIDIYVNSFMFT
jgi:hypothetical protein